MKTKSIIDRRNQGYLRPGKETSCPAPVYFLKYHPRVNEKQLACFEVRIGPILANYASFLGEADPQGSDLTEEELRSLAAITERELRDLAALAEVPQDTSPEAIVKALNNRPMAVWFGHANDKGMSILGFADDVSMILIGKEINEEGQSHE